MNAENPVTDEAALMQRDAAMMLLIAQAQALIQQLALLANSEKAAVAGLIATGEALAVYAQSERPDAEVVFRFDCLLEGFAPAMSRRLAAIRSVAPEPVEPIGEIAGLTHALKVLLGALAQPANGAGSVDDNPERMAGVLRSLLPRRP